MGLKNYDQQLKNLKSLEKQINKIRNFGNSMATVAISLQSVWSENSDFGFIYEKLNQCSIYAGYVAEKCVEYENTAIDCLNKMNLLENIKHKFPKGAKQKSAYSAGDFHDSGRSKKRSKIEIKTTGFFDSFRQQINSNVKSFQGAIDSIVKINTKIDPELKKHLDGECYRLLMNAADMTMDYAKKIETSLADTENIYTRNEENLKNLGSFLALKGDSSGTVDGEVNKTYSRYRSEVKQGSWPEAKYYFNVTYPRQSPKKCTMYANIYLIRRYMMMKGDPNWQNVDESTYSRLWVPGAGMVDNYYFQAGDEQLHVQNCRRTNKYKSDKGVVDMTPEEKVEYVKTLLAEHPEGVVIYDENSVNRGSGMHAVLAIGYNEAGQLMVIDPADGQEKTAEASGVIPEKIESVYVIDNR